VIRVELQVQLDRKVLQVQEFKEQLVQLVAWARQAQQGLEFTERLVLQA
jgi:hypothetical protein